jgi:hypothetical protein
VCVCVCVRVCACVCVCVRVCACVCVCVLTDLVFMLYTMSASEGDQNGGNRTAAWKRTRRAEVLQLYRPLGYLSIKTTVSYTYVG